MAGSSGTSRALGINDSLKIVGSVDFPSADGPPSVDALAFEWTEATGMQLVGSAPTECEESVANDANNAGEIVGGCFEPPFSNHATLWRTDGTRVDLGALPTNPLFAFSVARAINESGEIVGQSQAQSGSFQAFVWDDTNDMQSLGSLSISGEVSDAVGINASGWIVGKSGSNPSRAVAWEPGQGPTTALDAQIDSSDPLAGTLILETARGINDAGQIVANGFEVGELFVSRAYLLTPVPEPSGVLPLASGVLVLLGIRRSPRKERECLPRHRVNGMLVSGGA
jgi:probable HAF family extracellular repeat protein